MLRLLTDSDREIVMEYMERNHIESTFLIGNVLNFGLDNDQNTRRCADYFGYFENVELKGILPFYNLGSCIPHYESNLAVAEFAQLMRERNFSYLLGMEKVIKPLYEEIKNYKSLEEYSEDSYYINKNFTSFTLESVEFADGKNLPPSQVENFIMKAYEDGFGSIKNRNEIANMLNERGPEEDFIFLLKNGEIKAQANIQTYTSKINQVGGVFTLRSERGKGYCKAVVSEICRRIIDRGKLPTLMARNNNTPAVRAYTSLGFRYYDDYLLIKFKEK